MNNEPDVVPSSARKRPFILFQFWQWLVAMTFGIIAAGLLARSDKLTLPGAPIALFWIALAVTLIVAVLHTAPVFFRLPRIGILAAYGLTLPALLLTGTAFEQIEAAFEKTPMGGQLKAERLIRERDEAEMDAKIAAAEAQMKRSADAAKATAEMKEKVGDCLSWGGRFDPLEEEIKANLHNPHAFEHVRTDVIGPTPDGDNLEITFRAENGFGALREGWARAKINPETCELETVGRLNVSS